MTTPVSTQSSTRPAGAAVSADTYDAVPYAVSAFRHTDRNRLCVLSHVFGLGSVPPDGCRVLELGCASGGNIIPMGLIYPKSEFVGIDLSERQIADGKAVIRELGVGNVTLEHLSITDVTAAMGQFDYILCHGVYSWVPPIVQEKILEICRDHLTARGTAYISYNVFPGWHVRTSIREMLLYRTAEITDPLERIREARAMLAFITGAVPASTSPQSALLAHEIELIGTTPDTYLLHEYLEEFNEPLYFHEFIRRASAKGLRYLAEAEMSTMLPARFGEKAEQTLRSMSVDLVELEQNMDFLCNRMFRQTVLCRGEASFRYELNPEGVGRFYIASSMKPKSAAPDLASDKLEVFADEGRPNLKVRSPMIKAALTCLAEAWPLPIRFSELLARALERLGTPVGPGKPETELAEGMLNCYAGGVVDFTVSPPTFVTTVSERPVGGLYARHRARLGPEVTNLRMENVKLTDPARVVLSHLDGAHDKGQLAAIIQEWMTKNTPTPPKPERSAGYIDFILPILARSGLLQG